MSDDTPGVGQGALPPREGQVLRTPTAAERPTAMRLTQVAGGQYVLTTQQSGVPALAQLTPGTVPNVQGGVTHILSISPSRGQTSSLRPSLSNQSIVNVLTKGRGAPNVRLQLFQNSDGGAASSSSGNTPTHSPSVQSRSVKRPLSSSPEKKDTYSSKLQRVMNHRIVRSKLVKEKYAEHLTELFYLETGGNILDLYQYAKRPKTQSYLTYMREHAIDPKEHAEDTPAVTIPHTTPSTPSATAVNSLPGISVNNTSVQEHAHTTTPQGSFASTNTINSENSSMSTKANSFSSSQEQIVEKAKQEAYVVQRINDLQKEGLWSEKRLPKLQEMPRAKAHWDFLLEEMVWLAADFAQERKWKKAAAKKCARMVQKYFQDKAAAAQKAEKAQEQHLKRIASFCAKEIKVFWSNVEKLVEYKQNTILEEKRKKALDQQLSFIVDQTEKYSQLLAEGMNKSVADTPLSNPASRSASRPHSDDEFDPEEQSDEDDEETIEQEEAALENTDQSAEVEALQRESQMELDDLLEDDFLRNYLINRDNIKLSGSEDSDNESEGKKSKKSDQEQKGKSSKEKVLSDKESDSEMSDEESASDDEDDSEDTQDSQTENQSLKLLMDDGSQSGLEKSKTDEKDDLINDAAAIAESIQPKGNTLSSTTVSTKIPFLLKLPLREYQHIGLDWLVTMYERKLNGILADEMGLGKTIQTIALLAHLACEKGNWGPHLIVVPTSVMLNWEMECKKWCPAFKILTYYGSQKERKMKRTGWTKPNMFHICITSYKLVIQDHQSFRRKKWKYLILDEAQNIKNFKSQRWQLLLNFQTERRLLLTGTPLQNNLMELWSLMHFLMPNVFQSHREFKEWFSNPVTGMIEGNSEYNDSIIKRLHKVLRPFLLRRLKSEVEKQMPKKYEHVVMCRLSKRQRFLYDDYMSRAKTRETLASGNLLSVINVLMQLRKVCNHPNLFEVRPTISPFQCDSIKLHIPSIVYSALQYDVFKHVNLYGMNLMLIMLEMHLGAYQCYRMRQSAKKVIPLDRHSADSQPPCPPCKLSMKVKVRDPKQEDKKEPLPAQQVHQIRSVTGPSNVKMKVAGLQVVSQGVLKTVPLINISQAGGQVQIGTPINVSSVLKSSDKAPTSFAQLVQTSTGKHLLLTSNPNITGTVPVTQTTAGGQKLTFLSTKQPIVANSNNPQAITKAFVKFHLTSVPTGTTTTTSNSTGAVRGEDGLRAVNSNFLGQLYSKQNSLDVRWRRDDSRRGNQPHDEPKNEYKKRLHLMSRINERRCSALPLYGRDFQDVIKIYKPNTIDPWSGGHINCLNALFEKNVDQTTSVLRDALYNPERRIEQLKEICDRFIFYVPAVKSDEPQLRVWHPPPSEYWARHEQKLLIQQIFSKPATPLHHIASAMVTQFPDPRLIQYDCGKLQTLDKLLRHLKTDNHRVLIFTQMTKMLDVLEAFLNFHGHIYLRLDGTTKVDQRQVLMERFNGDKRIFAFILSTRSGGVGVNLTGADTVVFYDSDWNPTMDAQAQDRCHRIGQTRDVHIYRLVSERTVEENILKKANQKRLLGDLAIEGGNFTTAYFKSTTIQDIFNIDQTLETAAQRMSEVVDSRREAPAPSVEPAPVQSEDKTAAGALENALAACEDDQDVQAAKFAKAEAVADLAEFDENIPLDQETEKEKEPEASKAEQEINLIIEKLSPIEKYAMKFIEQTESAWSAEQLAAATRQIEEQKREWELNQMAAMREEEERRQRELEEENDMITYSREDATNQVWVSDNTMEQMPMWCPPTPPQQDTDVYIDQTMAFLYESDVIPESQLPPVYVKKDLKRRFEPNFNLDCRRPAKLPRKEDANAHAPRSLFHSPTLLKLRRDLKLQKYRGLMRPSVPVPGKQTGKPSEQSLFHNWTIHEDMALLKVIKTFQGLPLNLIVMSPGQTPNWDFVAEYVNSVSITYRSPKQCRQRYEGHLMHREEGKFTSLESVMRKKKKAAQLQKLPLPSKSRPPPRTLQLYTQDNNTTFSQMLSERSDTLKSITKKHLPTTRTLVNNPLMNKNKNTPILNDCGIDLDHPVLPVELATRRAERLAKEKKTVSTEQIAKLQLLKGSGVQQQTQNSSIASTSQTALVQGTSGGSAVVVATTQVVVSQTPVVITTTAPTATSTPGTSPIPGVRQQRIIASPLQTSTVVSVSGLSPAQIQAATQRLIVTTGGTGKTVAAAPGTQGKQLSQHLQMFRQATLKNHQLRLHAGTLTQGTKTSTVTIGGQQAVVQFTQAQPRAQFVRQGTVTVAGKTGVQRTVTETEMAQLLKKQQQLQQQKLAASVAQGGSSAGGGTIHGLTTQVFAQAIQQAGSSGTQVATLVKAVPSSSGATQTVTIPVTGVTLAAPGTKAIAPSLKATTAQQLRQMHLQQQLLAQKKLAAAAVSGQKLSIATGAKGSGVQTTQLIVGPKQAMTVQQFQQVIRAPLNVAQGSVVLAKGTPRVFPVNTGQGTKQTIQVVAASSQALGSTLRPQSGTTIAGIKLQGTPTSQQALLSQVSAALSQNVGVRQNSPVRIQTASGQPIVAVTVQSPSQNAQQQSSPNPDQC